MTSVVAVSQEPNGCVPTAPLSTALASVSLPTLMSTREFVHFNTEETQKPASPELKPILLLNISRKKVSTVRGELRPDLATRTRPARSPDFTTPGHFTPPNTFSQT